jgi:hypothetical protein
MPANSEQSQLQKFSDILKSLRPEQYIPLIKTTSKASSGILIPPYIDSLAPGVISDPRTGQTLGPGFSISGGGFMPNTTLTLGWQFSVDNTGQVATDDNAGSPHVGSDGTFFDLCVVEGGWLSYKGWLSARVTAPTGVYATKQVRNE